MKPTPTPEQAVLIDRIQAETDVEEARELIHQLFESGLTSAEAVSRKVKGGFRYQINLLDDGKEPAEQLPPGMVRDPQSDRMMPISAYRV